MDTVESRIKEWKETDNIHATLNLDDLGLVDIPSVPNNVERLNIDGNNIKCLKSDQLPPKIAILSICNTGLEHIEWLPETLLHLNARNNRLTELPRLPPKLDWLDISYNQITTLPNIPRRLDVLFCWDNPMPHHLIEEREPIYISCLDMYHIPRIRLWRKHLKKEEKKINYFLDKSS